MEMQSWDLVVLLGDGRTLSQEKSEISPAKWWEVYDPLHEQLGFCPSGRGLIPLDVVLAPREEGYTSKATTTALFC